MPSSSSSPSEITALIPALTFLFHFPFALLVFSSPISTINPPGCSVFCIFITLIITTIISPASLHFAVFVCAGCTAFYESCMLMRQTAIEPSVEWTNFRSAWWSFITAHKPKVSCLRWRGENIPCSTRFIHHWPALPLHPGSFFSCLSAIQSLKCNLHLYFPVKLPL